MFLVNLYKYLFYSASYYIKKYDHLWDVGDTYYFTASLIVGLIISLEIFILIDIFGILFCHEILSVYLRFIGWIPLAIGLSITVYLGVTKKHFQIYDEIANMDKKKKKAYRILNIIHLALVYVGIVVTSFISRSIITGN